ncbi:MAG: TetR/AcrR family transcriptional regulator [Bacteroidetes bacterium]|nr:TetR/AcrR family transcriptional regulator [Bacteroidota bacterium]
MENSVTPAEERILEAAKKVFHCKGYDGARMQEIADEAGVNKSLVHYYYRSKDNLFEAVFEAAFSKIMGRLNEIFFSELDITTKIETFVGYYVTFLSQNSYLPLFILNGLYEKPGQIKKMMEKNHLSPDRLMEQIRVQVKNELNLDIDPMHIYINILSLSVFPVIAKPLIQVIFGLSNDRLEKFYEERKTEVPEFILKALKGYEDNQNR